MSNEREVLHFGVRHTPWNKHKWNRCVCVCVCVCVCMGWFSGTHTQIISGKWGIVSKRGWPHIANSLLINLGGSIHAIGCPLALLESSIFSSVPGRKSYLLCYFFLFCLHFFGWIIAFFLGTSYEYTPWKWGKIHVPSYTGTSLIPRNPPHVCILCVCMFFFFFFFGGEACLLTCGCPVPWPHDEWPGQCRPLGLGKVWVGQCHQKGSVSVSWSADLSSHGCPFEDKNVDRMG